MTGILWIKDKILNVLQKQIPLWLVIVFLITLTCIFIIFLLVYSYKSSSKYPQIRYFIIGNYKWRTEIYKNNFFELDEYPYCIKHDLKFIYKHGSKYCPGTENEKCHFELKDSDFFTISQSAKSIIDNKLRNNVLKC